MHHILAGRIEPQRGFAKLPLVTAPQSHQTDACPMDEVRTLVKKLEAEPGVLCVSAAPGFAYSDVARLGFAATAYADDAATAQRCADEVAALAWKRREAFSVQNMPVVDAVGHALSAAAGPVVLVDVADNVGGGAPGDGTVLLRELLRMRAAGAVVTLTDPAAVAQCVAAGVRSTVTVEVGGHTDDRHGAPVRVTGAVRVMHDGVFRFRGPYMPGQRADMGRTAVLDCDGIEIVCMERPMMPFDAEQLQCLGIDPSRRRILVVKSAIAWKAAYADICAEAIFVDTPGICSSDLSSFAYMNAGSLYIA